MLQHLYIKNFALIDELDIDFSTGFSVITGETGAGKSIILGAIGLLLGQRADMKTVKADCKKCTVEALFDISNYDLTAWFDDNSLDIENGECIIRRELTSAGKSRGFINDTPVTLSQMKELGEMLVDVHSQHQNLLLQKEDFQLNVLDIIAGDEKLRHDYQAAYAEYRKARQELEKLRQSLSDSKDNEDFMRHQLSELTEANLSDGEQELLEDELAVATHTEEIKTALYEANGLLNDDGGIIDSLHRATNAVTSAANIYNKVSPLAERLDSALIELKDIAGEISAETESIDFNAERLTEIQSRLDKIYTLQHRFHKNTIAELLEEQARIKTAVDNIDHSDEALHEKETAVNALLTVAKQNADRLSETRRKAVGKVEKAVVKQLESLGMPNVEFKIDMLTVDLGNSGQDKVAFLFSANKGTPLLPVTQVASGGEIARLMLSLKALISSAVMLPTIIFDEIDTGVSGKIAEKMAYIMTEMGNSGRQVISITHLPQIAALGMNHYKVEKHETADGTTSAMRRLTDSERIDEIAQMLSGSDISEAARNNAKELLRI